MRFLGSVGRNALIVAVLASPSAYAAENIVDFNVPRGDLSHVVEEIAAAGGRPVAFPAGVGAGMQAGPITGRKTLRQALSQALAGSGLTLVPTGAGGYTVRAAQQAAKTAKNGGATDIADIDVAGGANPHNDNGFQAGDTGDFTRIGGPIAQNPLAVTAVTKDVLDSESATDIGSAAINSAGVIVQPSGVGNVPKFQIRGFDTSSPTLNGAQTGSLAYIPIDDIDRVEILKGPTSILTGVSSAGGAVNVAGKLPTDQTIRDMTIRVGSFGYKTVAFDLGGIVPQTEGLTYRFNISGNNANTNYAGYKNQHEYLVSPAVTWKDKSTSVTFGIRYYDVVAGSVPNTYFDADNNPIKVARNMPQGNPLFNTTSKTASFYNYITHDFGSFHGFDFAVENKLTYELQGGQTYIPTFDYLTKKTNVAVFNDQNFLYENRNLTEQLGLTIDKNFGWFKDKLRFGFDFKESVEHFGYAFGSPSSFRVNLTEGYTSASFAPTPLSVNQTLDRSITPGVSFSDKIDTFNDRLHIFGQVREDHFNDRYYFENSKFTENYADTDTGQSGLSWTAGGAFDVTPWMTVYGNRSNGFYPVTGTSGTATPLVPEQYDQSEVGARYFLFDKRLTLTTSFYTLNLLHVPFSSLTNPEETIQVGGQKSRGFEFEAQGHVFKGLDVIASFADQHAVYDNSISSVETNGVIPAIGGVPQMTASLWAVYTLQDGPLKGVFFGAGGNGSAHTEAAYSDGTFIPSIPGYVIYNFAVGYAHDRYSINVKLNNAFNKTYFFASAPLAYQPIYEGEQRNVLVTAKYSF